MWGVCARARVCSHKLPGTPGCLTETRLFSHLWSLSSGQKAQYKRSDIYQEIYTSSAHTGSQTHCWSSSHLFYLSTRGSPQGLKTSQLGDGSNMAEIQLGGDVPVGVWGEVSVFSVLFPEQADCTDWVGCIVVVTCSPFAVTWGLNQTAAQLPPSAIATIQSAIACLTHFAGDVKCGVCTCNAGAWLKFRR